MKKLAALLIAGFVAALMAPGCGDDSSGGGDECQSSTDCPELTCKDGNKARVCINKKCADSC